MTRFRQSGYELFLVGGAVRNLVLGGEPVDFDFATNATPDQVALAFRRVIPTGAKHGTVTIVHGSTHYEVTTYRAEGPYTDSRRPDRVEFISDIFADLARRDFTMNSMALDPLADRFLDPHNGEADIHNRLIRAIGDPHERFSEDALRMLRAIRFATQLEFAIDAPTFAAIGALSGRLASVSLERIRDELTRILASRTPSQGFRMMAETGLLATFLPELVDAIGVEQRGRHRFDVFEHSIIAVDAAPHDNPDVRLAALLHDIGKPPTLEIRDGERIFHGHDGESARMTETILRRLKYPNAVASRVAHLVRHHMFHYTDEWTDAAVRRFIARVGEERIADLIELRRADTYAIAAARGGEQSLAALLRRVADQLSSEHAVSLKDLAVNGRTLIEAGIPKGPLLGVVLEHLLETVIDDPSLNAQDTLVGIARRFYETRLGTTPTRIPTE